MLLWVSTPSVAQQTKSAADSSCDETRIAAKVTRIGVQDRFVGPALVGPWAAWRITFPARSNPLKGRRIIAVEPETGPTLFLSDRSAITVQRNVDGGGSVTGVTYLALASCLDEENRQRSERGGEIMIGFHNGSATENLRLERFGSRTRLSRVVRQANGSELTVTPLIVTDRHIEAVGVGPRPIDSPGPRVLSTVARQSPDTIILAFYGLR